MLSGFHLARVKLTGIPTQWAGMPVLIEHYKMGSYMSKSAVVDIGGLKFVNSQGLIDFDFDHKSIKSGMEAFIADRDVEPGYEGSARMGYAAAYNRYVQRKKEEERDKMETPPERGHRYTYNRVKFRDASVVVDGEELTGIYMTFV